MIKKKSDRYIERKTCLQALVRLRKKKQKEREREKREKDEKREREKEREERTVIYPLSIGISQIKVLSQFCSWVNGLRVHSR